MQLLRIGHRGAAAYAPENTLKSVEASLALAVDMVEIDVQVTADGVLVVMHDKRVDRTTTGTGYVREMPWAAISQLRDCKEGLPIPRLEEVVRTIAGKAELLLEVKDPSAVEAIISTLRAMGMLDRTILASFHHQALLAARSSAPDLRTLALLEGAPVSPVAFAREAGCTHVGLGLDSVTAGMVAALHQAGFIVFVYTVNDARDVAWVRGIGVDGIISDRPDIIR